MPTIAQLQKSSKARRYAVDYFQREFSWEQSHIEQLITDLTSAFLVEYSEGDSRTAGTKYNSYYLGPLVFIARDRGRSIIDGQQRLTSLTLFFIYLNHLQHELGFNERFESMIYSEYRGVKSLQSRRPQRGSTVWTNSSTRAHTRQRTLMTSPRSTWHGDTRILARRFQMN